MALTNGCNSKSLNGRFGGMACDYTMCPMHFPLDYRSSAFAYAATRRRSRH